MKVVMNRSGPSIAAKNRCSRVIVLSSKVGNSLLRPNMTTGSSTRSRLSAKETISPSPNTPHVHQNTIRPPMSTQASASSSGMTSLLKPMVPLGAVAALLLYANSCGAAITSLPAAFWQNYCNMLEVKPLLTKILTALVGCFLGDLLAQTSTHAIAKRNAKETPELAPPKFKYDVGRIARLMLFSLMTTPLLGFWYVFLDAQVMPGNPTSPVAIAMKVAADQLCIAPIMTFCLFTYIKAMEDLFGGLRGRRITAGLVLQRALASARSKLGPTMKACYMLWPLAHVINFALIPSSQRILYINAVSILWTAFLSVQAAAGAKAPAPSKPAKPAVSDAASNGNYRTAGEFQSGSPAYAADAGVGSVRNNISAAGGIGSSALINELNNAAEAKQQPPLVYRMPEANGADATGDRKQPSPLVFRMPNPEAQS